MADNDTPSTITDGKITREPPYPNGLMLHSSAVVEAVINLIGYALVESAPDRARLRYLANCAKEQVQHSVARARDAAYRERFAIGTYVRTAAGPLKTRGWTPEAIRARQPGAIGVVTEHHDSHGLCFKVAYSGPLDTLVEYGTFDPDELEVIKPDDAQRIATASATATAPTAPAPAPTAEVLPQLIELATQQLAATQAQVEVLRDIGLTLRNIQALYSQRR